MREPTNPADPNAVAVQALDGTTLGYIPRDETQRFQQPLCFGAVYSAGQAADSGNWGFRVRAAMNQPGGGGCARRCRLPCIGSANHQLAACICTRHILYLSTPLQVAVQPSLPPVQVLAVPPALAPYASLALMLSGPAWEKHKAGLATPSAK